MASKTKSKAVADLQSELDAELEGLDLEDEIEELGEEEELEDDVVETPKVRKLAQVMEEEDDDEPAEPAKNKSRNWTKASLVEQINGNKTLGFYSPEKPFKTSPARNVAFRVIQAAGAKGLTSEEWVGEVQTCFEDEGVDGSASGAVKFIQKATRRIALYRSDKNWILVEPMIEGGSRPGYGVKDGKIVKLAKKSKAPKDAE